MYYQTNSLCLLNVTYKIFESLAITSSSAETAMSRAEVDMDWVDPWVGLGWVQLFVTCVGWVGLGWVASLRINVFKEN